MSHRRGAVALLMAASLLMALAVPAIARAETVSDPASDAVESTLTAMEETSAPDGIKLPPEDTVEPITYAVDETGDTRPALTKPVLPEHDDVPPEEGWDVTPPGVQ